LIYHRIVSKKFDNITKTIENEKLGKDGITQESLFQKLSSLNKDQTNKNDGSVMINLFINNFKQKNIIIRTKGF
jgi:hypothetical protein